MHHIDLTLKAVIEACDRAISQEDYDTLMGYYAEDAALVVKPGMVVRGKENIRKAFIAIADYFQHRLIVTQGKMEVIEETKEFFGEIIKNDSRYFDRILRRLE